MSARRELIDVLRKGILVLPLSFPFLITGRPEEDILSLASSHSVRAISLDQRSEENKRDVYTYIEQVLGEKRDSGILKIPNDWPWERGIKTLADKADGLFIWASTAVKSIISKKYKRFEFLKCLVDNPKLLNLDDLYITVLEDALDWDDDTKSDFAKILSLILFGKSPLTHRDISDIIGLEIIKH